MKKLKLDQHGFTWHFILPVLAVIGVASVGAYLVSHGHAATPTSYSTIAVSSNSKECVDNKYNKKATFNEVQLYTCNGTEAQQWAVNASTTASEIINGNGYCLNVYRTGKAVGTPVDIYPCKHSAAQLWTVNSTTGAIKNPNSQLCLSYATPLISTGTPLKLATCNTNAASDQWTVHATSGSSSGGSSNSGGSSSSSSLPAAPALSSYKVLSQTYTASQMISGNWAQDANNTQEGGGSCPTSNTTYDAAYSAVKMSTKGTAQDAGSDNDCGHIRSASLISTNGTVVESRIFLPSSGGQLIDWASYWTDGTNWPATGELDAVETQYGQSYVTYHYGSSNSPQSIGTASWDSPKLSSTASNDAVPGWNIVDMEFEANYAGENVYINGKLYASVPANVIAHNSQYINWGISGPNAADPNHASWPSGAGYEEVQYLKVFTK